MVVVVVGVVVVVVVVYGGGGGGGSGIEVEQLGAQLSIIYFGTHWVTRELTS